MLAADLFAVITTYSFTKESQISLFSDYAEAAEFLKNDFEKEYATDDENGYATTTSIDQDGEYALLINYFSDHENKTEWRLTSTVYLSEVLSNLLKNA